MRARFGKVLPWLILLFLVVALSTVLDLAGLPSPVLFGALVAGLGYALIAPRTPAVPGFAFTTGQAVLGAAIGSTLEPSTLTALGADWLPVLLSCLATLLLSVAAGSVLMLKPGISTATGVFAMIAGGASGIVAISRDLGADDRVVAVVQYLRVLIILLGMPLVAQVVFSPEPTPGISLLVTQSVEPALPHAGLIIAALALAVGLPLARFVPMPAGALLFPLIVAAVLAGTGTIAATVPDWLQNIGFALIGLQVGLRFTRESLKAVASVLPLAVAAIIGLIVVSAGLGVVLAHATGRTSLEGYLATTPGGLYAVLATAVGSGADVTFVLMVQVARLFVMLFCAPLLARLLAGPRA
ncbi:AbrB family transcriptional regulator [Kineosporia sp. NBRC 101731]|uniref:AbrB family transcriptional regulator n=1 Tax=Kineosporia sp. NBRC 101731 TaxID=3032199 RepID=UPI0024A5C6CE|nr:AbrB family transcriptional regulator [Kineosporia sp. NBRC 101731]GLY31353.1 membrane protein [Kineosporia sp. NBRC 101731]